MTGSRTSVDRAVSRAQNPADIYLGGTEMLRLVQRMFLSKHGNVPQVVVFCGVGKENGSSAVCAAVGRTLAARTSRSVCMIDANLLTGGLSSHFRIDRTIASIPRTAPLRDQCIEVGENLWFAGIDLLASDRGILTSTTKLEQLFTKLLRMFDFVLIDAPGADVSGDTAILGQVADGTVLVIDAEVTRKITTRKVKESLDAAGVQLLGAVLYNRTFPLPKALYDRL